jgi:hypothetical protein
MSMSLFRRTLAAALALVVIVPLALDAAPVTQVPAGSTAAIEPAKVSAGSATAETPQGKILESALTKRTRHTLQEAMDSAPAAGR